MLANTIIVPFVLRYGYGVVDVAMPVLMLQILIGEMIGCYGIGELLCTAIRKRGQRILSTSADNM